MTPMLTASVARSLLAQRLPAVCQSIAEPVLAAAERHEDDAQLRVDDNDPADVKLELASRTNTRCPVLCVFGRGRYAEWFALFAGEADFDSGDTIENLGGATVLVEVLRGMLGSRVTATEWRHGGTIHRAHYTFHDWLVDGEPMTLSRWRTALFKRLESTTREWQPWR